MEGRRRDGQATGKESPRRDDPGGVVGRGTPRALSLPRLDCLSAPRGGTSSAGLHCRAGSAVPPPHVHVTRVFLLAALLLGLSLPAQAQRVTPGGRRAEARLEHGTASFYAASLHGNRTASGERYDRHALTAAHRTLPFGTLLRVTNQRNGRTVLVRVNDRGPFHRARVIDLSGAAADAIGMRRAGTARITFEIVNEDSVSVSQ